MTFELEISTMHKTKDECLEMLNKMNVHCDVLIINQCDKNDYYEVQLENQRVRIFFTCERGLSKSRNMALKNCQADILGIADDDLYYYDNFDKLIIQEYEKNPKADSLIFNMDSYDKVYPTKGFRCGFFRLFGFCSVLCTFRIHSIKDKKLDYNEFFGTGSKYIQSGEENIFLSDCYHAGLKIYYTPVKILRRDESPSSWFKGYDAKFLQDRGAVFYAMSKRLYLFLILQFAIRKKRLFENISYIQMLKYMNIGKNYILKIIDEDKN